MKISPRRPIEHKPESGEAAEPLLHWWMPLAGLVLAAAWGVWEAADDSSRGAVGRAGAFAEGILWPGAAIFAVTTFLVWLAWKVDLD